jgi:hypothetical protein
VKILIGVLVIGIIGSVGQSLIDAFKSPETKTAEQKAAATAKAASDSETTAYTASIYCEERLRTKLASPSTAEFNPSHDLSWGRFGDTIQLAGWVDAQNAFGAKLRRNWQCEALLLPRDSMRLLSATLIE